VEGQRERLRQRLAADSYAEYYGTALLNGSAAEAERVIADAIDGRIPEDLIRDRVIAAPMHRIGKLWAEGEISAAHEHLATQITYRVLALLREAFRVAEARPDARVLLAAVEGEQHVLGLQMAGDMLEEAGYDVLMLGADVPTATLPAIVADHAPKIVGFSATMRDNAAHLPAAVESVFRADSSIGVIVGGRGVPEDTQEAHWIAFTNSVTGLVETADALLRRPSLN
jgi:MerR family transcriptional regulator, light-induced transcriptional regulator